MNWPPYEVAPAGQGNMGTHTTSTPKDLQPGDERVRRALPDADVERPVGKADAAAILGISVGTLDNWTARCGIPHVKYAVPGNPGNRGRVVFLPSELLAWREQFRVASRDIAAEAEELLAAPTAQSQTTGRAPDPGPLRNLSLHRKEVRSIE